MTVLLALCESSRSRHRGFDQFGVGGNPVEVYITCGGFPLRATLRNRSSAYVGPAPESRSCRYVH